MIFTCLFAARTTIADAEPASVLLVGYSVARPAYAKLIAAFARQWKAKTGQTVRFKESYGGAGAQSRAVLDGLEADVLVSNLEPYVQLLADKGFVAADWQTRLPNGASPVTSVIVFVTRPRNPRQIVDWTDVARDGTSVVCINPQTSGNARWGIVGGYGSVLKSDGEQKADEWVRALLHNAKLLASGGREASDAFVKNHLGDVLLTFENEARFLAKVAAKEVEVVIPQRNIQVNFPVTVVDQNVDKHGTRKVAEAFVHFLFEPEAQQIFSEQGYRPTNADWLKSHPDDFPAIKTLYKTADLGGWKKLDAALFDKGGVWDKASGSVGQ